jgi:hypothetical protein
MTHDIDLRRFDPPDRSGVFGPELWIDTGSGATCLRHHDGTIEGEPLSGSLVNGFLVWVGTLVVVVSQGLARDRLPLVAAGMRASLNAPNLPIVFELGPSSPGASVAAADGGGSVTPRTLAQAEAYAMVQCGWDESAALRVELNGIEHTFRSIARELTAGSWIHDVS